jgi:hypothetical protein
MRSLSAAERRLVTSAALVAACCASSLARADDKAACMSAYEQTQTLRKQGKLDAAREQAEACSREVCAAFIRSDCGKWLDELKAAQPTMVVTVRDAAGQPSANARVSLDGAPWPAKVGAAAPVSPGTHKLLVEIDGEPPHAEDVVVRDGEKNHAVTVSFEHAAAPATTGATEAAPPARSPLPWIVGGVGVAGVVVGAVFAAVVLHDKSVVDRECHDATQTCSSTGASAASSGSSLGPVSTIGFVVGGVGLGGAAALFLLRKPAPSASTAPSASLTPVVSAEGAALHFRAVF